jgi:membrane protease YdiL (CAAX protease family)
MEKRMMQNLTAKRTFEGSLPMFPSSRSFGDSVIFLMIGVFMSFGLGAFVMMFLEAGLKGAIGLFSTDWRDFVFVANADAWAATSRMLGNAMDCGAALMFLWAFLQGKPMAATIALNVKRLRFGWIQALAFAVVGFGIYRGALWLVYDYLNLVQSAGSGSLVNTAKQLSGVAMGIMMLQTLVVAPILEEIVHRGFVYNILRSSLRVSLGRHVWLAEVLASVIGAGLFAVLHVFGASDVWPIFIGTLVLNELYRRTGSLVCPILLHVMMNAWVWYTIL